MAIMVNHIFIILMFVFIIIFENVHNQMINFDNNNNGRWIVDTVFDNITDSNNDDNDEHFDQKNPKRVIEQQQQDQGEDIDDDIITLNGATVLVIYLMLFFVFSNDLILFFSHFDNRIHHLFTVKVDHIVDSVWIY